MEPVRHFLEKAQVDLGKTISGHKAVNFYCTPLQVSVKSSNLVFFVTMRSDSDGSRPSTFSECMSDTSYSNPQGICFLFH